MNLLKDRHGEGDDGCAPCGASLGRRPGRGAPAAAEAACAAGGARLPPIRRDVLGVLYSTHRPLGAYDEIADALAGQGRRKLAPISVYRALDFLVAEGLVHRLASRNAYVACPHRHAPRTSSRF